MAAHDFLFEIGCEELPPLTLYSLATSFRDNMSELLKKAGLSFNDIQFFATPRRLAIYINQLVDQQPPQSIERQGPSFKAAYDKNGTPTIACLGFARACGVSTDQLQIKENEKGSWVFCRYEQPGKKTTEIISDLTLTALNQLPIPKPMRWGNHQTPFIRPVHWVVMMYGKEEIASTFFGKKSGRESVGHRYHQPNKILITQPKDYQPLLSTYGMVMVDFNQRKKNIREQLEKVSAPVGRVIIDEALLDEVTSMVEWPVVLMGQFKSEFLSLPPDVLITSMKVHQRCFPVEGKKGELRPNFLVVCNIDSKDKKAVIRGNERVINARLSDASFFYHHDLNHPLNDQVNKLKGVIFQRELGSLFDKAKRMEKLSGFIADQLSEDISLAKRTALLCKADLVSEMVYEFPTLQGVMGYYYAKNDKEPLPVAEAIRDHYLPRFSGDGLPHSRLAHCVALADRIDTLIGILGINKIPTGTKDPFGLRRLSLGILRIIIENKLPLDLMKLLSEAKKHYGKLPNEDVVNQAFDFVMDRLRAWYLEKGIAANVFSAVLAKKPSAPLDFDNRISAVQHFLSLPQAEALTAANKRVSNILKKQEKSFSDKDVDPSLLEESAEKNLAKLLTQYEKNLEIHYKKSDYIGALNQLTELKEPIDLFFDSVMVMVDNKKLRNNRLSLLNMLQTLFTKVADISLL